MAGADDETLLTELADSAWDAAAANGAFGAARGAELRLLPINKERAGAMP
ncbi:hypothetical protein PSE10C_17430 [Pseudomonas amygdali pv. eriobotryae]|nr:hypothetical protein PSE10C_17430 [Pseudomonas amygdali pv. eriobotryae]